MENRRRGVAAIGALLLGTFWIFVGARVTSLEAFGGPDGALSELLLDVNSGTWPLTVQNVMWVVFFVAVGELMVRYLAGAEEQRQLGKKLLPEDMSVLGSGNIGALYSKVERSDPKKRYLLQRLLMAVMLQFQNGRSVEHANAMFGSWMELYQHEMDLRYNALRYVLWLIPSLGFIGTVLGIATAMADHLGPAAETGLTSEIEAAMGPAIQALGSAFYTTLLALLQAAVLMFVLHWVQGREEGILNRIGQYCLGNLVNRLDPE